jgi:hypothetical protein
VQQLRQLASTLAAVHEEHDAAIARALVYVMNTELSTIKVIDLNIIWSEGIIGKNVKSIVRCA